MRSSRSATLAAAFVALGACTADPPVTPPTEFVVSFGVAGAPGQNFNTHLHAGEEVPANASRGQGQSKLVLSADGTELHYTLTVANIENVWQAHIHLGAAGENGPVVAFLYGPVAPGGGRIQGRIAEGTLTGADLIARPAIGFGGTMEELVAALRAGEAYVNVHTNAGAGGVSGPGHLPPGEIRGQIRALGPRR